MRLLIIAGLIYLFYRTVKSWMLSGGAGRRPTYNPKPPEVDDVMVKDPYCQVYFPKRDALRVALDGEELFFCSADCRDKFMAAHSKKRDSA